MSSSLSRFSSWRSRSLSLGEGLTDFDRRAVRWFHFFGSSVVRAFLTFDWDTPNCRAILAGVMPAL